MSNTNFAIIVVIILAILIIAYYLYLFKMKRMKIGEREYVFKHQSTAGHIEQLHPSVRVRFANFIEDVESKKNGDLTVFITSSFRTPEKQLELYNSGQTTTKNSYHNFGLAIDLNINGKDKAGNKVALRMASPGKQWQPYVEIAKFHGLKWGGVFLTGYEKVGGDKVHFELPLKPASELLAMYNAGKKDKNNYLIFA